MKRILAFSVTLLTGLAATAQTYAPVAVTGYTADVVANGSGSADLSTTNDVDGGSFAFVAANFVNPTGQSPASALPNNGTINSAVATTSGLTFQLASYSANNSLRISGVGSGALTFAAPTSADLVYVLATSGSGASAVNITVNFTDGSNQAFSQTVADWFGGANFAIQGISRVNIDNNGIQNSATDPRLYQYALALSAANVGKPIQSITFSKTGTAGVLNVMGISIRSVASPVANDVGVTAVSSPESGCGLTNQEQVTLTLHNFGLNAQSNIPVSYTINGGTPVTAVFAGPLASNAVATYTFATPANLIALGSYTVVVSATVANDTVLANNSITKTVVVSQTPAMPAITAVGPTTFCSGNYTTLSASTATTGASFQWMLNGNAITGATSANFAAGTSGSYSVVASSNGCSSAPSAATVLTSTPPPAVPTIGLSGPANFCSGQSVTLTAASFTAGATYIWLRNNSTIAGASGSTFTATAAGSYSAIAVSGGCTSTASGATNVVVRPTPVTPTISVSGYVLTSSSGIGNQWYKDGNPILGATGSTYTATATGNYHTVITDSDCSSDASNVINVVVSGLQSDLAKYGVAVFPNPSAGLFTLTLNQVTNAHLTVTDLSGRLIKQQTLTTASGQLDLGQAAKGVYLLQISSESGVFNQKLVVQ